MTKYYYILYFSKTEKINSYEEEGENGLFDSYEQAKDAALYAESCYNLGGELQHLSNPGDYDWDGDVSLKIKIKEIEV